MWCLGAIMDLEYTQDLPLARQVQLRSLLEYWNRPSFCSPPLVFFFRLNQHMSPFLNFYSSVTGITVAQFG